MSNFLPSNWLDQSLISFTPKIIICCIIMIASKIILKIIRHAIITIGNRNNIDIQLLNFLQRVAKYFTYAISGALILENLNIHIGPLLATLGVTGIGISFAMKDIISNLIAGILVLFYQPFKIGNTISAGSHHGKVISIDLRFTTLEKDNKKILIPNTIIYTSIITVEK